MPFSHYFKARSRSPPEKMGCATFSAKTFALLGELCLLGIALCVIVIGASLVTYDHFLVPVLPACVSWLLVGAGAALGAVTPRRRRQKAFRAGWLHPAQPLPLRLDALAVQTAKNGIRETAHGAAREDRRAARARRRRDRGEVAAAAWPSPRSFVAMYYYLCQNPSMF